MSLVEHELARIDLSNPRLIINTYLDGKYSTPNILEYVEVLEAALTPLQAPFVVIYDITLMGWVGAKERIVAGRAMGAMEKRIGENYFATISVIPNPVARLVSKGVALAAQPAKPVVFVSSMEKAQRRAKVFMQKMPVKL